MNNEIAISAFKEDGTLVGTYASMNLAMRKLYLKSQNASIRHMCFVKKNGERRLHYSRLLDCDVYFQEANQDEKQNTEQRYSRYTFNKQRTVR